MAIPEQPSDAARSQGNASDEIHQALHSIRTLINLVAFSLLLLASGLSVFFLREVSHARRQVRELSQMVDHYNKTNRPAMLEIRDKLYDFAKSHPDYYVIFTNYFNPATLSNAAPAGAADAASPVRMPSLPER